MQRKHKLYVALLILLTTSCAFLSCCFPGSDLARRLQAWETKRRLKDAQTYYENVIDSLQRPDDQLLINTSPTLEISDKYPYCIIGTAYFIHGSSASYQEIVTHYTGKLIALGWTSLASTSKHEMYSFANHRPVHTMSVSIAQLSDDILPITPGLSTLTVPRQRWEAQYRTVYVLWFIYADPEIGCWL